MPNVKVCTFCLGDSKKTTPPDLSKSFINLNRNNKKMPTTINANMTYIKNAAIKDCHKLKDHINDNI